MKTFSAAETEWMLELDGIELAGFWPRALAFTVDGIIVSMIFTLVAVLGAYSYVSVQHARGKGPSVSEVIHSKGEGKDYNFSFGPVIAQADAEGKKCDPNAEKHEIRDEAIHVVSDLIVPVLYFGVLLWKGKGRTPGKRLMKIRVVSIVHRHLSFWHCFERALGYGAATLELGFGFLQFFIHPYRRCAQDRLAETIVVTEAGYQTMQHKLSHPLIPDSTVSRQER